MTRSELFGYLADPRQLDATTLDGVRQLQESYPYCGTFAFLYLYNLAATEDIRYPAELRRLAPILPDSQLLYRLVEATPLVELPPVETEEQPAEDAFDLIDHFLEGARASGEDLPESLHFEGGGETGDYFSSAELASPEGDHLPPLIPAASPSPVSPPTESFAVTPASTSNPTPAESASEGLLSETLAKIYIQQGHYDKALRIIRSLSLKYPEKSRFFVDQIRFLERLIQSSKSTK